jgi:hypothetical protein
MTARRFTSSLAVVVLVACAAPANEGTPPASPSSPAAPAPAASPPPTGSGAGEAGPTNTAPATATDDKSWPFAPAPTADELKAQLDRLAKDQGPIKSNWVPPGKSDKYGHAEGMIGAPYDVVKARLLDFPHYKELAGPKFKKVNVVDKQGTTTDLYFQLPIMKGLVTIWYVTRFATARSAAGGAEVIEGKFVKGNIKDMQIVFSIRPGPDKNTIFVCDLDLALNIPAPQAALDEELRDACGDAVNSVRARVTQP